MNRKKQEV